MPDQPAGRAKCLHSFPDPYPQPLDQPGNCRGCDTTYQEAKAQMPAATVVTARSVSLNITGAPDVPNRDGEGHIAPSRVDFTYRPGEVRAWLEGRWRRADGVLADAPASQPYTGDMAGWPDWLADLARKHDPRGAAPSTDQAALREQIADVLAAYDGWKWAPGFKEASPTWHGYQERAEAVLSVLPAPAEDHRLALSMALSLGTGAPWDAIHDRATELGLPPLNRDPAARRLGLLPSPADRAAVLEEAAVALIRLRDSLIREPETTGSHLAGIERSARELRRLAAEAHATNTQADEDPARIDRLRPEFTEHSSIEAIDAQLRRARSQERRWHLRTEWLVGLRATRMAQKARGEWPAVVEPAEAADTETPEQP